MGMFYGHNQSQISSDRAINGYLYNYYAASDVNFAPTDWKVPEDSDYSTLITTAGGSSVAGGKLKDVGLTYWDSPNTGATDQYGFQAYGSGLRLDTGVFDEIKESCRFWTQSLGTPPLADLTSMFYNLASIQQSSTLKELGLSIRLVYTGAGTPSTVVDNDGNVYDVVQIGSQRWTVQNWKCTTLSKSPFTAIPNVTDGTAWSNLTTLGRCAYDNDEGNV